MHLGARRALAVRAGAQVWGQRAPALSKHQCLGMWGPLLLTGGFCSGSTSGREAAPARQQESSPIGLCWGREEKKSLCADGGEKVSQWELEKRGFSNKRCSALQESSSSEHPLPNTGGGETPGGAGLPQGSVRYP